MAYGSLVLSLAEQEYCVMRRELLAIVHFVQLYRPYLYGRDFLVRTDHAALQYSLRVDQPSGQMAQGLDILQGYSFTIQHRKGTRHVNADALSRLPQPSGLCRCTEGLLRCGPPLQGVPAMAAAADSGPANGVSAEGSGLLGLSLARWTRLQVGDFSLSRMRLRASRSRGSEDRPFLRLVDDLFVRWDVILQKCCIVVPLCLRGKLIRDTHEKLMHLGEKKTALILCNYFYWPGMQNYVHQFVKSCHECARRKAPVQPYRIPLQSIRVSRVNEIVGLDILGPFPVTPRGHKYLLVGLEYLTRWPMPWPLVDQLAGSIAEAFLQGYVLNKGAPEHLLTDHGNFFSSRLLKEVCDSLSTKKIWTFPYHPQTEGTVQRLHRMLTSMLCQQVDSAQTDWDLYVPVALAAYRLASHASTGYSPFYLMFGLEPEAPALVRLGVQVRGKSSAVPVPTQVALDRLKEAREASVG